MLLVTGAAGASGRLIVKELSQRGLEVRALVRDASKAAMFSDMSGVEVVNADMSRRDTLGAALQDVDTVMLISSSDEQMRDTQCTFVEAARAAGVRRIVKFSGQDSGIGFDATAFRFTRWHEEIERYIEGSGMRWTHLRPSQFMQVYLREAPAIARGGVLSLPLGDIELSPVDLQDVAAIAAHVLADKEVDGQSLVITGPEALTMADIARTIGQSIDRAVSYRSISIEERSAHLLAAGMSPEFVRAVEEQTIERLKRPRSHVVLSTHERYGIKPRSFAEFARQHRTFFQPQA